MARQSGEPLALGAGDVDEEVVRGDDVRDVESLVGEPGQRPLGEGDELDRHVDADHRHGGVDPVLDRVEVRADVLALTDPVDHRREADCEVRRHRLALGRRPVVSRAGDGAGVPLAVDPFAAVVRHRRPPQHSNEPVRTVHVHSLP